MVYRLLFTAAMASLPALVTGADAAAITCHDEAATEVQVVAEAAANALARAVVRTSQTCTTTGTATANVTTSAYAKAAAQATAVAIAEGYAAAESCNCTAATEFFLTATDTVFVEAVAKHESQLLVASEAGGSSSATVNAFVEDLKNETLVAFSEILLAVSASAENGCLAVAEGRVTAGDSVASCEGLATGASNAISVNASATAGLEASAIACGETVANATGIAVAKALAEAIAIATVEANLFCSVSGEGSACALGDANASAIAVAQAEAFASAYAEAKNDCGCDVDVDAAVSAIATTMAEAFAEVFAQVCVEDEGIAEVDLLIEAIDVSTLEAVATAIASAVAGRDGCSAFVDVSAEVIDQSGTPPPPCKAKKCARNYGRCGGVTKKNPKGNVKPCCDDDFHCVERNSKYAQCRPKDKVPPKRFSGKILDCTRVAP